MEKTSLMSRLSVALVIVASLVLVTIVANSRVVLADGNGSPAECLDSSTVLGSQGGEDSGGSSNLVVVNVGDGKIVDGVCIKSGSRMFAGNQHSGVLGNGQYSGNPLPHITGPVHNPTVHPSFDDCYEVSGVGTQVVTVKRNHEANRCQGISHIDVLFSTVPYEEEGQSVLDWQVVCSAAGDPRVIMVDLFNTGDTEGSAVVNGETVSIPADGEANRQFASGTNVVIEIDNEEVYNKTLICSDVLDEQTPQGGVEAGFEANALAVSALLGLIGSVGVVGLGAYRLRVNQ